MKVFENLGDRVVVSFHPFNGLFNVCLVICKLFCYLGIFAVLDYCV